MRIISNEFHIGYKVIENVETQRKRTVMLIVRLIVINAFVG